MQAIANFLVVLVIISCGFSIMMSPFAGKKHMDPFIIIRPIVHNISKGLHTLAKKMWQSARTQHPIVKALLYLLSTALSITGFVVGLPSHFIGSGKKS